MTLGRPVVRGLFRSRPPVDLGGPPTSNDTAKTGPDTQADYGEAVKNPLLEAMKAVLEGAAASRSTPVRHGAGPRWLGMLAVGLARDVTERALADLIWRYLVQERL